MKKQSDSQPLIGAGAILGGLVAAGIGISNANKKKKEQEQLQQQIAECNQKINDIDREIDNYRSRFMGSILYSNEINELLTKRQQSVKERAVLQAQLK